MDPSSLIGKISVLPTPDPVLRRIMALAGDGESSVPAMVEAVRLDPAVAGRILRIANSARSGIPLRIASLQNAVNFLGAGRVKSIILLSRNLPVNGGKPVPPYFSLERFWRHSVLVGLIAESIGRHQKRYIERDEQELYAAGLVHDIGKLALLANDSGRLNKARTSARQASIPFYKAEDGISHPVAGGMLAHAWNWPPEIRHGVSSHHEPSGAGDYFQISAIIHSADIIAHVVGYSVFDGEAIPQINEKALQSLRLPPERLKIIAETEMEKLKGIELQLS